MEWEWEPAARRVRVAPKSTVAFFPFLAAPFLLTQLPLGAPLLLLLVVYFALTSASNNLQRSPSLVLTTIRKRPG